MSQVEKLQQWTETRMGLFVTAVAYGVLTYLLASIAIDSGSWFVYLLTFIFLVFTVRVLILAIKNHVKK